MIMAYLLLSWKRSKTSALDWSGKLIARFKPSQVHRLNFFGSFGIEKCRQNF
jgi:hypothetical protein